MKVKVDRKILLLFFIVLVGCQSPKSYSVKQIVFKRDFEKFRISEIPYDYSASCKIQIKKEKEKKSSNCMIYLKNNKKLKITIDQPFGGNIAILYMDQSKVQFVNRLEKVFFELKNNQKNRSRLLMGLDFSIDEFQSILWGRETKAIKDSLTFIFSDTRPSEVIKEEKNEKYLIVYEKWQSIRGIEIPRQISIKNNKKRLSVKLVLIDFKSKSEIDPIDNSQLEEYKKIYD